MYLINDYYFRSPRWQAVWKRAILSSSASSSAPSSTARAAAAVVPAVAPAVVPTAATGAEEVKEPQRPSVPKQEEAEEEEEAEVEEAEVLCARRTRAVVLLRQAAALDCDAAKLEADVYTQCGGVVDGAYVRAIRGVLWTARSSN